MAFDEWIRTEQTLDAVKFGEPVYSVDDMRKAYEAGQKDLRLFRDTQQELWEKCAELTALQEKKRWHYPSKGELPEKDRKCLVYQKDLTDYITIKDGLEYFSVLIYDGDTFMRQLEFGTEHLDPDDVLAWQYLPEPPKEID